MSRKEILSSPEYWIAKIQMDLYNCAESFMHTNNMNRTQIAQYLGVSKGYVSQLLNGDYNHRLSKLVELAISFGFVPKIEFQPIAETIEEDKHEYKVPEWDSKTNYVKGSLAKFKRDSSRDIYESVATIINTNVA